MKEQKNAIKPNYYKQGLYDLIDHAKDLFTKEEVRGFFKITAYKYIMRYEQKNGVQDLSKAIEVITRAKEFEEGGIMLELPR